ncbi:cuticle protein AMP1B-like [Homarus americanus]|uniref:cuticle protein AMP1B-like n=1 Tax=Homarus americanus TaxID=6706 RepID=UPI001C457A00|nr:cuticle protein AMP1B-like [Homarus americanus]
MNMLILSCLLAVAAAAPQYNYGAPAPAPSAPASYSVRSPPVEILRSDRQGPDATGAYNFLFESADGISRQEQGAPQGPNGAVASQGGWSFTYPDGTPAVFTFVADGAGYRVQSDLLPTPPPLPAHAIAQIEKARQEDAAAASAPRNSYNAPVPAPAPQINYSYPQ